MTEKNYITIQGFMLADNNLRGNDLILYALIYGFSQDGETEFRGSLKYMGEALHISKRGVQKILSRLEDMGYLRKVEIVSEGVKYCRYVAIVKDQSEGIEQSSILWNKVPQGIEQSSIGYRTKFVGGIEQSSTHNNSIDNKLDIYKDNNPLIISPLTNKSDKFRETWEVLLRQPKWKKKSKDAIKASLKKLDEVDEATAIKMMQNTIANGWQGLFLPDAREQRAAQQQSGTEYLDNLMRSCGMDPMTGKFFNEE